MKICVFGAASSGIEQKYKDAAYRVGTALAKAGYTMVFGGGGGGMMGASARGCHENGGRVIGILPDFFKNGDYEELFEDSHETIYTADIAERLSRMEAISDGFIVLPGGIGTYEEFFKVLVSICLDRHSKTLAVLNVDGFFDPLQNMLREGVEKGFIFSKRMEMFRVFEETRIPEMIAYLGGENTE